MSSEGQTWENNCLVVRYFLYFSCAIFETFSFILTGFYNTVLTSSFVHHEESVGKD